MIIHVVKPGETVVSIAAQYGVLPDLLSLANGVGGQSLVPGQTLTVRYPAKLLTVQPGDTLYSIALREGVSVLQLWRCNPWLWGTERLYPGQTLVTGYQQEQQSTLLVTGYAYPYIREDLLRQTLPYLSACIPFTYGFTPEGRLLPLGDGALLALARQYGAESWMNLSTLTEEGGFSSALAEALLQNDAARARLAAEIAAQMAEKGYAGLDVDFEYLPGQSAAAYADFIRQLREALSPGGAPVTVALAPKTSAGQAGLLYEGHDYAALGAAADYCLLMTYEWGYAYSAPMAVSPIPKIRQVLDYAVTAIPAKKLLLGISSYGYDWPLPYEQGKTRARSIGCQQAITIAREHGADILFDESAQAPYFRYTAEEQAHEVWFEDARSIRAKLGLAAQYGLAGVGYWNLMRPFPQNWQVLDALCRIRR